MVLSLLGYTNINKRFIKDYFKKVLLLIDIIKKDTIFLIKRRIIIIL